MDSSRASGCRTSVQIDLRFPRTPSSHAGFRLMALESDARRPAKSNRYIGGPESWSQPCHPLPRDSGRSNSRARVVGGRTQLGTYVEVGSRGDCRLRSAFRQFAPRCPVAPHRRTEWRQITAEGKPVLTRAIRQIWQVRSRRSHARLRPPAPSPWCLSEYAYSPPKVCPIRKSPAFSQSLLDEAR